MGGNIHLENCCYLDRLYPVSEWDSNYDGAAIFDFYTGWGESGSSRWVTITPGNSMRPNIWFYGEYTLTLTDVTGLQRLVSNTNQRGTSQVFALVGKNIALESNPNIGCSTAFTTGSNPSGYTLDRITAYISMTDGTSTGAGVPDVAIHSDGTDKPGTKFCDLRSLLDYDTGLILSNGDWPDRLYAPGCADNTLAANTTHWVVFTEDSSPNDTYWVAMASNLEQDQRSLSGWGIGDSQVGKTNNDAWMPTVTGEALAIGVYGTPK